MLRQVMVETLIESHGHNKLSISQSFLLGAHIDHSQILQMFYRENVKLFCSEP